MQLPAMKSNDALLNQFIELDSKKSTKKIVSITDHLLLNPTRIKVDANQLVYLHFFCSEQEVFNIELHSATQVISYTDKTTFSGLNNQIVRCLSNIDFRFSENDVFYVQYTKVTYQ